LFEWQKRLSLARRVSKIQLMTDRIEINPRVCNGQPVIKGTRISIAAVLEQLAEGQSWDAILRGYPELTRADIQAVLDYARHSVLHTKPQAQADRGMSQGAAAPISQARPAILRQRHLRTCCGLGFFAVFRLA